MSRTRHSPSDFGLERPHQTIPSGLYGRIYRLPVQLERARARVRQLETEALRLGLNHLVKDGGSDGS